MDYYSIGQRIRNRRKQAMLSQEELAEKIGISTTHMSHIETGNTKLSLQVLVDIAQVLHVSTDELLFVQKRSSNEDCLKRMISIMEGRNDIEKEIILDIAEAAASALQQHL